MQGLFLSSNRENTGVSACEKKSSPWRGAYLAKPERIKKNALYRINGSAPRQILSRGTAIYSDRGQKWLTRRHRQKDLALKLFEAYAGAFYPQPSKIKDFLLTEKSVHYGVAGISGKARENKENTFYRINGSASRHGDIFFMLFGKKHSEVIFMSIGLKCP